MIRALLRKMVDKLGKVSIAAQLRSAVNRKQVLLACFPKSGSTFISTKISEFPCWTRAGLVPSYGRRDQHLCGYSVFRSLMCGYNIISQHHCRADQNSIRLLNKYNFKVIVLSRSLMDVAVSMSDHWDNETVDGPRAYLDRSLLQDIDQSGLSRLQFIVKHMLPWYISFYVSWQKHWAEIDKGVIFLTYESFFGDKEASLLKIMNFIDEKHHFSHIGKILKNKSRDRLNKGIVGRGVEAFQQDSEAYNDLLRLLSFYPSVDFSPIFTRIDLDAFPASY